MDCLKVKHNIQQKLRDYIVRYDLNSLVLGVSGGVDSALVAALAKSVCDTTHIKLYGRSLPILTNKTDEIDRARKIGKFFCHDFKEIDLGYLFHEVNNLLEDEEGCKKDGYRDKIRQGNIKARLRMIYLYNLAFLNDGMVLSTDNLTEYNLGFSTIMGDWGDYVMIQNLWKTEVYELANFIANELCGENKKQEADGVWECIAATATDGLGVSNSDLEQIGASSYDEVDNIFKDYFNGINGLTKHPVVKRHENSHFKRNWPITIERNDLFK